MKSLKLLWEYIKEILNYPLFKLSDTEFTSGSIFIFIFSIVMLMYVSRLLKNFLVHKLLVRYNEDIGIRQAMGTIVRYVFVVLGLFVIIQASGIDLSGLAIIGGALSVGIGFGLQSITNNFVSGIVILLERPIKVGDRIEVGGTTGDVVAISARATTVTTNDNISVIIPNSEFITSRVINWSYNDRMVRFKIPINVAYGSDPRHVEKLLVEVASENKNVLKEPKPGVRLMEFGESSLKFELRAWSSSLLQRQGVLFSEINFAIYEKFKQHGVKIPFPQMDIHINQKNNNPMN